MTKICSKCKIEKDVIEFYKNKSRKDGHQHICKLCQKQIYDINRENKKISSAIYYLNNKEKRKKQQKTWQCDNRKKLNLYMKKYNETHKKERNLSYNKWERNKLKIDLNFKLLKNYRGRIRDALKNSQKSGQTLDLLGCTSNDFKLYLEKLFIKGMSWDNYGIHGWHIDHIIPCSFFNMEDPVEQKQCFHYTNLQPLWALDNLRKSDKILNS